MKKYITIAALLAAGTAFANAETVITTTFSHPVQTSEIRLSDITLTSNWADSTNITDEISTSIAGTYAYNGRNVGFVFNGDAGTDTNFLGPWTDVSGANYWTLTFTYNNPGSLETIDGITLSVGAYVYDSVNGFDWQNDLDGTATFTVSIGTSTTTATWDYSGNKSDKDIALSFSNAIDVSTLSSFSVAVSARSDVSTGIGLRGIDISGTVIPEPSAFGLLAGLGALALVGTRRRRK